MEIAHLIDELRRPEAYPHDVSEVEVRQTHISVVFLAGPFVYKVKKPVDLGFLDFTTPERRLHFCREEVRLNRRLAPEVYREVVPIVRTEEGLVVKPAGEHVEGGGEHVEGGGEHVEGDGEPVEHAVKMVRLPDDHTLLRRLVRGELSADVLEALAARIADFHAKAASGPEVDRYGRFDVVAGNARENLEQSSRHVGTTLSPSVHERLSSLLEERLGELRSLIDGRAQRHVPRDTHGDLHLDHVYLFPEREPPNDLVVIDCVEFNQRFRYADPVADTAFLAMDLIRHGRRDLADAFADAWVRSAGDGEGERLLPFYVSYRAAVRGKVRGMASDEEEIPEEDRTAAIADARAHWLLALSELEDPDRRPCLVLVGGLPGTGKSTLTEGLARRAGFHVISSDRVRKELAGLNVPGWQGGGPAQAAKLAGADARSAERGEAETNEPGEVGFGEGIYTPEWNDRTYQACLERAGEMLSEGERVLVDASFREAARRRRFLEAATECGVRSLLLLCEAEPVTVRRRLDARQGDVSDADWSIYLRAAGAWEGEDAETTRRALRRVSTDDGRDAAVEAALSHLRASGLAR